MIIFWVKFFWGENVLGKNFLSEIVLSENFFSIKHDLARSCFQFWIKVGVEGDKISREKNWLTNEQNCQKKRITQ